MKPLNIVKTSKKEKKGDYGSYYHQNNTPIVAIIVEKCSKWDKTEYFI
ncbi:MAG: hypothetical protein ACLU33_03280 [Christensenellales bacterium]